MRVLLPLVVGLVSLVSAAACGPDNNRGDDGGGDDSGDDGGPCSTRIGGIVYAPNGTLPLYGVNVYVPQSDPGPNPVGVQCAQCVEDLPGGSVVRTVSNESGVFLLDNVPPGDNVKVVITVGKWRKQITVPRVERCELTELSPAETSLPKTKSEGDMPQIAVVTGAYDSLECLVRRIGVADSEFTNSDGAGAIHLFASNGANTFAATHPAAGTTFKTGHDLWGSRTQLDRYDAAFFGCEGEPQGIQLEKTQAEMDNVKGYADGGGRVFLTHYQNIWIDGRLDAQNTPPSPATEWKNIQTCSNRNTVPASATAVVDTVLNPKGVSFFQWMRNVDGVNMSGVLPIEKARQTCENVDKTLAEQWLFAQTSLQPQMYQFTTPQSTPLANRCGKVVFTDMHVVAMPGADVPVSIPGEPTGFPASCSSGPLSAQEKALAFMFFDIASCVGEIL